MNYQKLLVWNCFKEYSVENVTQECYENSPKIENAGSCTAFKIESKKDLNFKILALREIGFNLALDVGVIKNV